MNERVKQFFDRISGNMEREKEIKNLTHDRNIDTMRTQSAEKNVSITGMPNGTLFTPHERQRESTHSRAHPLILWNDIYSDVPRFIWRRLVYSAF